MTAMPQAQPQRSSEPNRYPIIFSAVANLVGSKGLPVLSYGCSSGYEPMALADYFPESLILGVDVHPTALAEARQNTRDCPRVSIAASERHAILSAGPFGAIFAMSVLCRWPETKGADDISEIWPFADFEAHIRLLDEALAPGGVLAIYNSNYNFRDSDISAGYDTVADDAINGRAARQRVPRFDRDGVFRGSRSLDCVFVKRGGDGKVLGVIAG